MELIVIIFDKGKLVFEPSTKNYWWALEDKCELRNAPNGTPSIIVDLNRSLDLRSALKHTKDASKDVIGRQTNKSVKGILL